MVHVCVGLRVGQFAQFVKFACFACAGAAIRSQIVETSQQEFSGIDPKLITNCDSRCAAEPIQPRTNKVELRWKVRGNG